MREYVAHTKNTPVSMRLVRRMCSLNDSIPLVYQAFREVENVHMHALRTFKVCLANEATLQY